MRVWSATGVTQVDEVRAGRRKHGAWPPKYLLISFSIELAVLALATVLRETENLSTGTYSDDVFRRK
jgi:hypothetical protein